MGHSKLARLRKDKYYQLAKETGYRSRAAFKLIQLNRKYSFLQNCNVLVDLCAAPGGWLQVASAFMPVSSIIIGIDLVPIKPIRNVITHVCDISSPQCLQLIKREIKTWKVDCVLHDGAPNVGTSWEQDSFGQAQITLHAIKVAVEILSNGGCFITKVFRSSDYNDLLELLKQLFKSVIATKPAASRKESAEIFVVCKEFIGHKNINPRQLEIKNVFAVKENQPKTILTVKNLLKSQSKVNRGGYDDDSISQFKIFDISEFVSCEEPLVLLSKASQLVFGKEVEYVQDISTTDEIKDYCKDIKVLGMNEIKTLLLWRKKIRKSFSIKSHKEMENFIDKIEETEEEKLSKLIEETTKQEEIDSKRKLKKMRRKKLELMKIKQKAQNLNETSAFEMPEETDLFSLKTFDKFTDRFKINSCDIATNLDEEEAEQQIENHHSDNKSSFLFEDYEKNKIFNLELAINKQIQQINDLKAANQLFEKPKKKKSKIDISSKVTGDVSDSDISDKELNEDIEFLNQKSHSVKNIPLNTYKSKKTVDPSSIILNKTYAQNDTKNKIDKIEPEKLALAEKMLESNKFRRNLVDDSWNRYTYGKEDLPEWFKMDENAHNQRILPITKEEVDFYRQRMMEIASRPLKKVAEARARRKLRLQKSIDKAREISEKITGPDYDDIDREKNQQLKNTYKQINKSLNKKKKKTLLIARKHNVTGKRYKVPRNIKGPVTIVDRRMKKDKRTSNSKDKSSKKSKSKHSKKKFIRRR